MKKTVLLILLILGIKEVSAQVAINTDGSPPHPSAMLDVSSDNLGFLLPRSTNPEQMIQNPAEGLLVYDVNQDQFAGFTENQWVNLGLVRQKTILITSSQLLVDGSLEFLPSANQNEIYKILSVDAFLSYGGVPYSYLPEQQIVPQLSVQPVDLYADPIFLSQESSVVDDFSYDGKRFVNTTPFSIQWSNFVGGNSDIYVIVSYFKVKLP